MAEQREGRGPLNPGDAFKPLVKKDVPELPGIWLGCG